MTLRFPIRFESWYAALSSLLLLPPSKAYVQLEGDEVEVRMGWAFGARFPRASVASVATLDWRPLSRGVHGFGGRWLVNGAGAPLMSLALSPEQRGRVMGVPVRLRELMLSVDDSAALRRALGR